MKARSCELCSASCFYKLKSVATARGTFDGWLNHQVHTFWSFMHDRPVKITMVSSCQITTSHEHSNDTLIKQWVIPIINKHPRKTMNNKTMKTHEIPDDISSLILRKISKLHTKTPQTSSRSSRFGVIRLA